MACHTCEASCRTANTNDMKTCTMHQPCTAIAVIAQDPDFHVLTSLLWIRAANRRRSDPPSTPCTAADTTKPLICLKDAINGMAELDHGLDIREDKPDLGLLHLHRDRLAAAAEALGWRSIESLEHTDASLTLLRDEIEKHLAEVPLPSPAVLENRKLRVLIDKAGAIEVDSVKIGQVAQDSSDRLLTTTFIPASLDESTGSTWLCEVWLDRQPTRPSTLSTHKTTHRCIYTSARERLHLASTVPPTSQEVLLYNPYGEIIETSACTIYFNRDGNWITPAAICGPNLGVTRRLALEKGLCRQGTIEIRELQANEEVWLSNAVRGFFRGVLRTDAKRLSESAESKEVLIGKMQAGVASGPVLTAGCASKLKRAS